MIDQVDWVERTWTFHLPAGAFPCVVERVRGTPARARALVAGWPEKALTARRAGRWSAKEHIGHLEDLALLDARRLDEFRAGVPVLTAADIRNRKTEEADHRHRPMAEILAGLTRTRDELVRELEAMTERETLASAIHPRLGQPMRVIDWVEFVADHDDHHLASAREALSSFPVVPQPSQELPVE